MGPSQRGRRNAHLIGRRERAIDNSSQVTGIVDDCSPSLPVLGSSSRIDRDPSSMIKEDNSFSTTAPIGERTMDNRVNDLGGQNLATNLGLFHFDKMWQSFDGNMDIGTLFSESNAQFI